MWKATGYHHIIIPQEANPVHLIHMEETNNELALSPGQALSHRVLRISQPEVCNKICRVATWNVKSLYQAGKLDNAIKEMRRLDVSIMGISEVRWKGANVLRRDDASVYYSCSTCDEDTHHRNGVAVIVSKALDKSVKNYQPISDRVMVVQIAAKPFNINVIQVYAPTADKPDTEVDSFYHDLEEALRMTRTNEVNLIMGDFNAKIGSGRVDSTVGGFGLGDRNERGDRLVEFCQTKRFVVTNTWFKHPPRRIYTWRSPQDSSEAIVRNQIDYILINQRFRCAVKDSHAFPGADISSDHNPVVAKLKVKLARAKLKPPRPVKNVRLLRDEGLRIRYEERIGHQLQEISIEQDDVDCLTRSITQAVCSADTEFLGAQMKEDNRPWMSEEILALMEERRLRKVSGDRAGYSSLQRRIKHEIWLAKESWLVSQCETIEALDRCGDLFNLHKEVRRMTGSLKRSDKVKLLNSSGEPVLLLADIHDEWLRYTSDFFSADRPRVSDWSEADGLAGPSILESEVRHALKCAKSGKAPGPDDVYSESLKCLGDIGVRLLARLFNVIYDTGRIPYDWLLSTFVMLPKKPNAAKCKDHRPISLMSHLLKVFLRILHCRLYRRCEGHCGETQFGFKSCFGTREAIFSLQVLAQNCLDYHKDVWLCFLDYEKAFDSVQHAAMIESLKRIGVDGKDIRVIENLYWNQRAAVKLPNGSMTETFDVERGVRQGCILSPLLFNIYMEQAFLPLPELDLGIKVNGAYVNNIRYADDTVLIADSQSSLQRLVDVVADESLRIGLRLNISKTKFMVVSRDHSAVVRVEPLTVGDVCLERVQSYKYLGALVNEKWDPEVEIRSRIEQARSAFVRMKALLCNKHLKFDIRYRAVKCYVWSVLLYGAETWTLKAASINRLEAFEMWCLRRMFRISWVQRVRNTEVLRRAGLLDRELFPCVKKRKVSYLGHILRGDRYAFQRLVLEGKIEGRRGIGRKQLSWLRNIRRWTGIHEFAALKNAAIERTLTV